MLPEVAKWILRVCPLPREGVRVALSMGKYILEELVETERPEFTDEGQNRSMTTTPYTKIDERVMDNLCSMFDAGAVIEKSNTEKK